MQTRNQRGAVSKSVVVGAIAVLVVLAALAALLAGGGSNEKEGMTAPVTVEGTPLVRFASAINPDPAVGQTAPTISGTDFGGAAQAIRPDGKSKVVLVLAHWCPHCRAEVPRVVQGINGFEFKDANGQSPQFYAISTNVDPTRPNYPPDEWLAEETFIGPVIRDDEKGTAASALGTAGFPTIVALDGQNKVLWRGEGRREKAQLVAEINGAFSGAAVTQPVPGADAVSPAPSA